MGARNIRASHSPLHEKMEALIWAMECMKRLRQFHVIFATNCSQLVKMVSEPEEWSTFIVYLEEFQKLKNGYVAFQLKHIPRTHNLFSCTCARNHYVYFSHMNTESIVWSVES